MSVSIHKPKPSAIIYPESDGEPIAENTLQFEWIVTIKEGLDLIFHDRPDVFVAGDLFWYPVEGRPDIRTAPDTMVAIGRPKGHRPSYKQWEEGGVAPQVVFEVLSPGNRPRAMIEKYKFYEKYGCLEYYIYDPDDFDLTGYQRAEGEFSEIPRTNIWVSPCLGIRFDMSDGELKLFGPDGRRFLTYQEIAEESERLASECDRATQERDRATQERDRATQERDRATQERDFVAAELDAERQRTEALVARLRALGVDPAE